MGAATHLGEARARRAQRCVEPGRLSLRKLLGRLLGDRMECERGAYSSSQMRGSLGLRARMGPYQ